MKPIDQTPTEPHHYALLSSVFASLLAANALSAGRRQEIPSGELLRLSAASFALSKLLVNEKVETWVRAPFVEESAAGRRPKGRGMRYAVGELLSCTRCAGAWSALALTALQLHAPKQGRLVSTVLAASAGNDFLQTAFCTARELSNRHESLAQQEAQRVAARQAQATEAPAQPAEPSSVQQAASLGAERAGRGIMGLGAVPGTSRPAPGRIADLSEPGHS